MDAPTLDVPGLAAHARTVDRWYAIELKDDATHENAWDDAHVFFRRAAQGMADERLLTIEPDIEQRWYPQRPSSPTDRELAAAEKPACTFEPADPSLPGGKTFAWHLDKDFTRLAEARGKVTAAEARRIKIAHLDTGFDPDHVTCPEHMLAAEQRNFVPDDGQAPSDARDPGSRGILRNPGHGPATLALLAGNKVSSDPHYVGWQTNNLGGAPLAQVVPIRVATSVVHFWTSTVAEGFAYAHAIGADVLSMSMGGLPSALWADAVNKAYESGMVMVCAAGNNYSGFPTREIVWPARFERVIAACGVMANMRPYYNLPLGVMQGNYGPPGKMHTAMAAFTPNTTWARLGCKKLIDMDGAGTSSATPQIAAAAALWLAKNGDQFPGRTWQRAEAARVALFASARKSMPHVSSHDVEEMLGRGILDAAEALEQVPKATDLKRVPPDSADFTLLRALPGFGAARPSPAERLLEIELGQLVSRSRTLQELVAEIRGGTNADDRSLRQIAEALVDGQMASAALRRAITHRYAIGHTPAVSLDKAGPKPRAETPSGSRMMRRNLRALPAYRRLRMFAIDPSYSTRLDTAFLNEVVAKVPWEASAALSSSLKPGPVGEYVEVVDIDPPSACVYEPIDLDDPLLLASDGLAPSEGNPQFHQQMVYAVAMTTISHFERALGRRALWAPRQIPYGEGNGGYERVYVPRLRIYPHALRQDNAYYSPDKIALLFGYFPATVGDAGSSLPGGMVFTCLSHDIIAHETTHALLDGLHRRFAERTNPDMPAFHEAFSDIVALFQHFTFPEIVRYAVIRHRGDLAISDILAEIGKQFGDASGRYGALRNAIGPRTQEFSYSETMEAHDRGAILVAAVFDAFVAIYKRRTDKLLRVAGYTSWSGGDTSIRTDRPFPSELVDLLAEEASKTASHVLRICIRALDYCPPVDLDFGDYLRALVTCDADLVPDDPLGYRLAFLEAFRNRGIFPRKIRTLSLESLNWREPEQQIRGLGEIVRRLDLDWNLDQDRRLAYEASRNNAVRLHRWLTDRWLSKELTDDDLRTLGIDPEHTRPDKRTGRPSPRFEVHSIRPAHRATPDGRFRTEVVAVLTQSRVEPLYRQGQGTADADQRFRFRGGATLIIDAEPGNERIRYSILKPLWNKDRLAKTRAYLAGEPEFGLRATYGLADRALVEPFALLHSRI